MHYLLQVLGLTGAATIFVMLLLIVTQRFDTR
jgi:hypothetical protein